MFGSNHVICLIPQADYKSRCSDWLHETASLLQITAIKEQIVQIVLHASLIPKSFH